jgi:hypothetical protein
VCACVDIEELETKADDARVDFTFGTITSVTSRAAVTTSGQFNRMGVFGYSHNKTAGWAGTAPTSLLPDYFLNKMVWNSALDGTGTWKYDGVVKYWPDDARSVSFFAYAPYVDNQGTFELYPETLTDAGQPTIDYTVPAEVTKQVDLLYGAQLNQTYSTASGTLGTVKFSMQHALSQLDVSLRLDDVSQGQGTEITVNSITFEQLYGSGTLTLSTGVWSNTTATQTDYLLSSANGGLDADRLVFDARETMPGDADYAFDYRLLNTDNGHLMVIPVDALTLTANTDARLVVNYTEMNLNTLAQSNKEAEFALNDKGPWEAGKRYTFTITLSPTPRGSSVEIEVGNFAAGGSALWTEAGGSTAAEGEAAITK